MRITVGLSCPDTVITSLRSLGHRSIHPISPTTQLLIATSVQDRAYRSAISLGIPVILPEGLIAEISEDTIRRFRLPIFAGLRIATSGFHAADRDRIERFVRDNGGTISSHSSASHIILDPAGVVSNPQKEQKILTPEWIRECEDLGWCANESKFLIHHKLKRRSAPRKGQIVSSDPVPEKVRIEERLIDVTEGENEPNISSDHGKYRRYQLVMELYQSEINTLKSIDFIVRLSSSSPLSQSLSDLIFYSFHALHPVYTRLISALGETIGRWNDESTIGDIYTTLTDYLMSAFLPYFHSLEASLKAFKKIIKEQPKFAQFIEEKEKDRSIGRQKIEHLLSSPSQQLMSRSTIMLKEILQHTQPQHDDFSLLQGAVICVEGILEQANENRRSSAKVDEIISQIDGTPAIFFLSPRQLLGRFSITSNGGTGSWQSSIRSNLLLLLNDFLLVATTIQPEAKCMRSQPEESFRYLAHVSYDAVREIARVEKNGTALFFITIRSELSDEEWRILDEGGVEKKALDLLMKQVRLNTPRAIFISNQSYSSSSFERQSALSSLLSPSPSSSPFDPYVPFSKLRTLSGRLKKFRQPQSPMISPLRSSQNSNEISLPTSPHPNRSQSSSQSTVSSQDSVMSTGSSIGWSLDENDSRLVQSVDPYENGRKFVPFSIRNIAFHPI
uniref:BRCT domain-containing protein n=1 Tax=Pristionchus pacificus TaxID=54126 RepID=A0A8R1YVV4_PRIPA